MIEAAKVISIVQRTPSYLDKQYLLAKNAEVEGLRPILKHIYNPYHKTGISAAKLRKAQDIIVLSKPYVMGDTFFVSYKDMIKYFETHQTGTEADILMAARFINCTNSMYNDPSATALAEAIVTQDLQIGASVKTLNEVFGDKFIPTMGCMLGKDIDGMVQNKIEWPCIVTEKLDGIRRILVKENGVCHFYSRSGHEDAGLVDILADAEFLPDNRVYDGELLAIGSFPNSIALRQASMSRSAGNGIKHGLTYNVFDMLPSIEFFEGASDDNAMIRKMLLGATLMDDSIQLLDGEDNNWPMLIQSYGIHTQLRYIKFVPILGYVRNMAQVEPIVEKIWARGGEGVMLNVAEGSYELKRTKSLLKVKYSKEMVLKVINMTEGTGKYEDTLGALVVEYKGNAVKVGSGFSDAMRAKLWQDPELYIGKYIEVETFGESANMHGTKSINCPIFKRFVDGE